MNIEISREQKEALSEKIGMCLEFLKTNVQPYLSSTDNVVINMNEFLDLCITRKKICARETHIINLYFVEIPLHKNYYLEKAKKNAKKYICYAAPRLALDFMHQWEKTKQTLLKQVAEKNEEVSKMNNFINDFEI